MGSLTTIIVRNMQHASALLQARNFVAARAVLGQIVQDAPDFAEAHRLLAGALLALGDRDGAERSLRRAVAVDPDWAPAQSALGELLIDGGRTDEGERALRRAAAHGSRYPRATYLLACLLNESKRHDEVLEITAIPAKQPHADVDLLHQRAIALSALNRLDEAIALYRRIIDAAPGNASAEMFLARALDAADRHREAEQHARRAIAQGADTAEARYLHARTLIATGHGEEAESLLSSIVDTHPRFVDAHSNLTQLIWMRTGDAVAAAEHIDRAQQLHPDDDALAVVKAQLLAGAGDARAALASLHDRADAATADVSLLVCASQTALQVDAECALAYAERAVQRMPTASPPNRALIESLLGVGDAHAALQRVEAQLRSQPDDQYLIAVQTTAWRLLGDPRYAVYCDYANMARGWRLDTPAGWSDLPTYLADLAVSLQRLHTMRTHPLHQSLRHGSQTAQNLLEVDDPAIRAFFAAIDGPIRRHIATIGHGDDPLRRRSTGHYRIAGIWSVRLSTQGYHTNHVHPKGWLSSACYIQLPNAMSGTNPGQAGYLKFGEPGNPTRPPLAPEYFIRPEPGLLALFPSYFWHGTVPFDGDDTRLTIAFDLVPG